MMNRAILLKNRHGELKRTDFVGTALAVVRVHLVDLGFTDFALVEGCVWLETAVVWGENLAVTTILV